MIAERMKTSLFALLLACMVIGLSMVPGVLAHDDTPSHYRFSSSTVNVCYDITSLNAIKYEGDTNQGSTVAAQIQLGEDEMDDNTDFNLTHDTSCGAYKSRVSSFYDSDTSKAGKTDLVVNTTLGNEYKDMEFNNNSSIDWQEDQSCLALRPNLDWIANHEYGHFAGMTHHDNVFRTHTMMKPSCSSAYSQIGNGDVTQVNKWY